MLKMLMLMNMLQLQLLFTLRCYLKGEISNLIGFLDNCYGGKCSLPSSTYISTHMLIG